MLQDIEDSVYLEEAIYLVQQKLNRAKSPQLVEFWTKTLNAVRRAKTRLDREDLEREFKKDIDTLHRIIKQR